MLKFFQREVSSESSVTRASDITEEALTQTKFSNEQDKWESASRELASNRNEGLWAKCFVEADGDENKAKAAYLKYRFKNLSEENGDIKNAQPHRYVNDRFEQDRLEIHNQLKYSKYMNAAKLVCIVAIVLIILIANIT